MKWWEWSRLSLCKVHLFGFTMGGDGGEPKQDTLDVIYTDRGLLLGMLLDFTPESAHIPWETTTLFKYYYLGWSLCSGNQEQSFSFSLLFWEVMYIYLQVQSIIGHITLYCCHALSWVSCLSPLEFVILDDSSSKHGNILPHKFLAKKKKKHSMYVCLLA